MNEISGTSRETFIQNLVRDNYTTFLVATHPKYSTGNPAFRFTDTPVSAAVPYSWAYQDTRRRLLVLSGLLQPEEAERRNINFVNPGLKDFMPAAALPTLRGGIQLLLPNEQAISHRHTANAFRLVFESEGDEAYSTVEGHRLPMRKGDLILTPNWTWHDHHNEGESHVIWYDGLDVMVPAWIGGMFYQEMADTEEHSYQEVRYSEKRVTDVFGAGLIHRRKIFPDHVPPGRNSLIYYPYKKVRRQLEKLFNRDAGHPSDGVRIDYTDPNTGGAIFPTMDASIRLIGSASRTSAMHRTENILFITMEGSVTFHLPNNRKISTDQYDVTVVPSWVPYEIENDNDQPAVLFSQSDRPLFEKLHLYREQPVE